MPIHREFDCDYPQWLQMPQDDIRNMPIPTTPNAYRMDKSQ